MDESPSFEIVVEYVFTPRADEKNKNTEFSVVSGPGIVPVKGDLLEFVSIPGITFLCLSRRILTTDHGQKIVLRLDLVDETN